MKKPLTIDQYLPTIEALCARSEQCSFGIYTRLRRLGFSSGDIQRVIDDLIDRRFIDDHRFALAYAHDHFRFGHWGRIKIRAMLIRQRIPSEVIDEAVEQFDTREYARTAFSVVAARLRKLPAGLPQPIMRNRLMRYGLSRGFEQDLLVKIFSSGYLWRYSPK